MIKLRILDSPFFGGSQLYIVQEDAEGNVTHVAKPVDIVMEPYSPYQKVPSTPTLDFGSMHHNEAFLQSVADALRQRQKPSPTDNRLLGQLEATERHLNDLQMLLCLKANPHREAPNGKPLE